MRAIQLGSTILRFLPYQALFGRSCRWDIVRLTMPADGRIDSQLVGHQHLNVITFINFNQRARLLAIDKIDLSIDAVCVLLVESSTWISTCLEHYGRDGL